MPQVYTLGIDYAPQMNPPLNPYKARESTPYPQIVFSILIQILFFHVAYVNLAYRK